MLINELPDECLLAIFDYLNDCDDLINCFKVCVRWSYLVSERSKKVKLLIKAVRPADTEYSYDCVYYRGEKQSDGTVLKTLFENLTILGFRYEMDFKFNLEDMFDVLKHQKSLKGLIYSYGPDDESFDDLRRIAEHNEPEMLSTLVIEQAILLNGSSVKQLVLWGGYLAFFEQEAHNFPNLERLHIPIMGGYAGYDGPVLEKMKVLGLFLSSWDQNDLYHAFQLMDRCPNLKSSYVTMESIRFFLDDSLKNSYLEDLVLKFSREFHPDWNNVLKRLFTKYPNLKHLSLSDNGNIQDKHIKELIEILPNLVLFDARQCPKVTQSAAIYVKDHCKRYGRSIYFYFKGNGHEIKKDWPQLSTKGETISRGFDFMKHYFLKDFRDLPVFMVPIDC